MPKVGYLGPDGTYSEIAAKTLQSRSCPVAYHSFPALFKALKNGEVSSIVVPVENTVNGAVTANLDLLQQTDGVIAKAAAAVKIGHRLITLDGADISKINRIYSHPQAFGQCAEYLASNFPEAKLIETSSTAESVDMIKLPTDAGIVGEQCARKGYTLSPYIVSDEVNNYTMFLSVERGEAEEDAQSERVFFSFTCMHRVGALLNVLKILAERGINMTEIESRPIKDKVGEFRFFIEIEGSYADENVKEALAALKANSSSFKLLGYYSFGYPQNR